jgi:AbrB family looped-hinge helix DNA binding protein
MAAPDGAPFGKRGTVVLPAALRRQFGIEEGTLVIAEARADGILIRPAVALPVFGKMVRGALILTPSAHLQRRRA